MRRELTDEKKSSPFNILQKFYRENELTQELARLTENDITMFSQLYRSASEHAV
jgi:hypothetical protein